MDQLRGRLVAVLVGERQAKVVQEENHLKSLWRSKHSSPVLVQLGHNRVEDRVLGNPWGQIQGHCLLCFKVETLRSQQWHQIYVARI